jgi:RNA polymerase sigma-70 factor (ECF subfamily)
MSERSKGSVDSAYKGVLGRNLPKEAEPGRTLSQEESALLEGLRRKDEQAFTRLVERYSGSLMRLARVYVPNRGVAEEVVQETWLGVLQGVHRFEGRCSLKTWLFKILMNRARTRGVREARSVAVGSVFDLEAEAAEAAEPALPSNRFRGPGDAWPDHWAIAPKSWGPNPEQALLSKECRKRMEQAIEALPPGQREVITLRDIEQWTSEEVCNALGVSETNQRVLLHRARSRVRRALEQYFEGGQRNAAGSNGNELQRTGGARH